MESAIIRYVFASLVVLRLAVAASPPLSKLPDLEGELLVSHFNVEERDIRDVVKLISRWTGKNFIVDDEVKGKITILGPSEMTLSQAYQAFLTALAANGYTTVQGDRFIRIISSREAKRSPLEVVTGEHTPEGDQFVTYIHVLKHIRAEEIQKPFSSMTSQFGRLYAHASTNSLILTDTGANIKRIKAILDELDVEGFEISLHTLVLNNGSAKEMAQLLSDLFGVGSYRGNRRGSRRLSQSIEQGDRVVTKILADESSNSLVIMANEAGFAQIRAAVAKLDLQQGDGGGIHVYACKYAIAEDLAKTLSSLGETRAAPKSKKGRSASATRSKLQIAADKATNSLVILAHPAEFASLKEVIEKLDIPRQQVFVETAIIEVAIDTSKKLGTNLAIGGPDHPFMGGFVGDAAALGSLMSGGILGGASIPILAGGAWNHQIKTGNSTSQVRVHSFMGLLNLLEKDSNTSILSTPQILALDNQTAEFRVQDEIPVQEGEFSVVPQGSGGLGIPTGRIKRLKTGINIKLTPYVNSASDTVRLDIEQEVNSIKDSNVPEALAKVNKGVITRAVNTSVVVKDGHFIMLGGLISDKEVDSESKVPLLGDIPVLGWLFKSTSSKLEKTNLILLLRPKIIRTVNDSYSVIENSMDRRDKFIEKEKTGKDVHQDWIKSLKRDLKLETESDSDSDSEPQ